MADDPREAVFAGKRALVVGGTGGIGRAIAQGLAKKGAAVTITGGSSPERLEAALAELNKKVQSGTSGAVARKMVPGTHSGFLCRVGGPGGLSSEDAAAFILEKTDCDIMVLAWGPYIRQPLHETKPQEWLDTVENNLVFPGIMVSSVLPDMIGKGWGRILLFGGTNTAGIRGFLSTAAYSAAKTALGVLAKSAARSAGKYGVTCNVLCPGLTETEYTSAEDKRYYRKKSPGGKALTPEEVAACALAILENSAINGTIIPVDRGTWI